jgi:hypothetical protein
MSNGVSAVRGDCNGVNIPYIFSPRATISVAVGETYTLSATVEFSAGIKAVHIRANRRSTNEYFTSGQLLNYDPTGKGVHRISVTFTSPSAINADDLCLSLNYFNSVGGAPAVTEWAKMGQVLIEKAGTDLGYFDGASAASAEFTYAWVGTANNSASVQQASTVSTWSPRWFGGTGGQGSSWRSIGTGISGGAFFRKMWLIANTGSAQDTGISVDRAVVEGSTYTASIYQRCSIDQYLTCFIQWFDSSNTVISSTPMSAVLAPANTWTRGAVSGTAPVNAVKGRFIFGPYTTANPMPAGTTLDFDWAMLEETSVLRAYQDGTPSAPGDYTYTWSGTAHNSTSQMRLTGVTGYTSGSSVVGQSAEWSNIGTKSLRITPTASTADSFVVVPVTLATGKTYTITATLRLEAPQTGTLDTVRGRRIYVYHSNVAAGGTVNGSTQSPNVAGVYQHSVTFTVTDGSQYQNIRLYNGAALGGGDVWWDNVLVEEADHAMPYFDGSTTPDQDFTHAWSGTAHNSTSLQRVNLPTGVTVSGYRWGLQSTEWSARGTKSLKIPHLYAAGGLNTDNFVEVHNMISGSLKPNTTYTMAATCRTSQVLGGVVDGLAFKFRVNLGSDISITYTSTKSNTAGIARVIGSFTTPATVTMNFIRLMAGASYGNGDVWWDELSLEEGLTDGSYFDGGYSAKENLVRTNAGGLSNITLTTGVNYAGQVWTRSTAASGTGTSITRQNVSLSDLSQGAIYTASVTVANDQAFSQQITLDWCDQNSQGFTIAPGETRRISVTASKTVYDNTFKFSDLEIIRSAAEPRSILYKDWVIERGSTLGQYYTGSEFTTAWSSTVDNSVSYLKAPAPYGWAQSSNGFPYQSAITSNSGTKSAGVQTRGTNGDGVYHQDVSVAEGKTYTLSAWIKLTSSVPSFSGVLRFKDNAQTIISDLGSNVVSSLTIGSWSRVSVSGTAPVGATKLQAMWRIYANHTPTTFYVDGTLLEDSTTMLPYFDGSTPASGDFTYSWQATPGYSYSEQRAITLPVSANRDTSILDGKFLTYQSTDPDGKKFSRWVAPAGTPGTRWRVAGMPPSQFSYTEIKAGRTYTLWFRWRSAGWINNNTMGVQIADATSQNAVIANEATGQLLNQNGWVEYRRTFTALRDATGATMIYLTLPLTSAPGQDGILDIREWALYEGTYTGDFVDGSKSNAKWYGTANASTSIGYPPRFMEIAGKPLEDWTSSGNYTLDNSFGLTEDRTFYTIYDTTALLNNIVANMLAYGETNLTDTVPNSFITVRQNSYDNVTVNSFAVRRTGALGLVVPGQKIYRHIGCWGMTNSGLLFTSTESSSELVDNATMAVPHQKMIIYPDTAYHKHLRTFVFRGKHDAVTQAAMFKYLGNKYGVYVP